MPNPKPDDFIQVVIALLLATLVVINIKWFLVPTFQKSSGELSDIWRLELVVVLAVLGAFFYSEIIEGMRGILNQENNPDEQDKRAPGVSSSVLVGSFGASIAIYLAAWTWLRHVIS